MAKDGRSERGYSPKPWILKRIRNECLSLQDDNKRLSECKEIAFGCPKGKDLPYFPEMDAMIHPITDGQVIIFAALNPRLVRNTRSAYKWSNDGSVAGHQLRIERCRMSVMDAVVDMANSGETKGHLSGRSLVLVIDLCTVRQDNYTAEKAVWYTEVAECRRDVEAIIAKEIRTRNNKSKFLCVDLNEEQRRLDRLVRAQIADDLRCDVNYLPSSCPVSLEFERQNTSSVNQSSEEVGQVGESVGFTIGSPEISSQTEVQGQQLSQIVVPDQQFSQIVVPDQQFSQTEVPDQQFSQTEVPDQQFSQTELPDQQFSQTEVPDQNILQTEVPDHPISPVFGTTQPETTSISSENVVQNVNSVSSLQTDTNLVVPETPVNLILETAESPTASQVSQVGNPQVPEENPTASPDLQVPEEDIHEVPEFDELQIPVEDNQQVPMEVDSEEESFTCCLCETNPLPIRMPIVKSSSQLPRRKKSPRQSGNRPGKCLECPNPRKNFSPKCLKCGRTLVPSTRTSVDSGSGRGFKFQPLPENNWMQLRKDWALLLSVLAEPRTNDSESQLT